MAPRTTVSMEKLIVIFCGFSYILVFVLFGLLAKHTSFEMHIVELYLTVVRPAVQIIGF